MQAWFPKGEPIRGRGSCVLDLTPHWLFQVGAGLHFSHTEWVPISRHIGQETMAAQADSLWAHAEVTTWLPGYKAVTKMEKEANMNLPCTLYQDALQKQWTVYYI